MISCTLFNKSDAYFRGATQSQIVFIGWIEKRFTNLAMLGQNRIDKIRKSSGHGDWIIVVKPAFQQIGIAVIVRIRIQVIGSTVTISITSALYSVTQAIAIGVDRIADCWHG